ncbi:MAG: outer membrane protein [Candidatus Berkiella sp.]
MKPNGFFILSGLLLCSISHSQQVFAHSHSLNAYQGPSLGVWGGGAITRSHINTDGGPLDPVNGLFPTDESLQALRNGSSPVFDSSLPIGGAQLAFNMRKCCFVYGAEFDFGSFNLNRSRNSVINSQDFGQFSSETGVSTSWIGMARGRAGVIMGNNFMVYATGGAAFTDLNVENEIIDEVCTASSKSSDTKAGWVVGGGIEVPFAPNWNVKAEYDYVDFGNADTSVIATANGFSSPYTTSANLRAHIARIGLNYNFCKRI